jgi:acetoacetyl-CoA synthetase
MTSSAGDRGGMILRRADRRGRSRLDSFCAFVALPRTLTGKRLEVPIKRIFQSEHARAVVEASAVSNPQSLAELEHLAASWLATTGQVS